MKYLVRKSTWMLIALLLGSTQPKAQQLQASLSHFSSENGLSSNAIAYMAQDDYGFLWLATWNGLSRFDGYNFYNYRTGNGSHIPFLHNRIHDIVIDNSQNIWLRMYDGRVFVVDRATDRIVDPLEGVTGHENYHTNYPLTATSSGDVIAFFEGVGLYKMHLDRNGLRNQLYTTGNYTITSVAEGYQNDIWLGTNQGVHRLDQSNLSIERKGYFTDEYVNCLYSNGYNIFAGTKSGQIASFSYGQEPKVIKSGDSPVSALLVDSYGLIWYGNDRNGASRFDPKTGNDKFFSQVVPVLEHDGYGALFREAMGTVWVRMNHGGYGYYNRETDEVEYFHNDPSNPWNLSNTVNASLELNEGVVWMSTSRRGLEKLEILKNTITRTQLVSGGTTADNEIRAMLYDPKRKTLLMGNKNTSLFVIHSDGSKTVITHDSNGNPIGRSYGLSQDAQGNYWLCSKDNGLFKITPSGSGYNLQNFRHSDQDQWSLNSNSAYAAVEDRQGNIWVATYGGGVNVLTRNKEGKLVFIHPKNIMRTYPANSHQKVRTIALHSDGNVWAGTTDGILIMSLDKKSMEVTVKRLENSEEKPDNILMSNDIVCLALDKQGTMWVGTNGGGLSHTVGQDSKGTWLFESYTSENGLPSEEIKSITFDQRGSVWFASDHILCSFDTGKKIFSVFSSLDGVDETMCSEGAAISVGNDNVLFGTLDGYYTVDRKKLVTSTGSMLKLHITDFFLNNELQSPRLNQTYNYYVPGSHEVRLPSHDTEFALRFASLNYQLQHRVHYQYRLEGYDRDWHNSDKSRTAVYNAVPSGTYHFKVKAFLLESPEKYDMRELVITVPPYFLLSSGAIWLYMLLLAVIALWLMFWRQKQLALKYAPVMAEGDTADAPFNAREQENSAAEKEKLDDYVVIE